MLMAKWRISSAQPLFFLTPLNNDWISQTSFLSPIILCLEPCNWLYESVAVLHESIPTEVAPVKVLSSPQESKNSSLDSRDLESLFWHVAFTYTTKIAMLSQWGGMPWVFGIQSKIPAGKRNFFKRYFLTKKESFFISLLNLCQTRFQTQFPYSVLAFF